MFQCRNIFLRHSSCRSLSKSINVTHTSSHATVTSVASRLRIVLSRSHAADQQTVNFVSRLPASQIRLFSSESGLKNDEVNRKVEDISEKFKEAMELLEDARSSVGTVYFSEDMTDAENAIQEVLADYDNLMKQMNENQKRAVVRTIGLKIEELKAQVQMLKDSLKE